MHAFVHLDILAKIYLSVEDWLWVAQIWPIILNLLVHTLVEGQSRWLFLEKEAKSLVVMSLLLKETTNLFLLKICYPLSKWT